MPASERHLGPSGAPPASPRAVVLTCRPPGLLGPGLRSLGVDPLQSLRVTRPSDPLGPEADSHEVPCPYDGIPRASPHVTGRSAPVTVRSRVFSTPQRFASTPGLRGLVSCRSHPWGSSLRSVAPRRGRVPLSGPPLLPCGCRPTSSPPWCARPCCSGFHRRARREAWLPGSPPELPAPFQPPSCCHADDIPDTLDRTRRRPAATPASSASKPSSPHEAVPRRRRNGDPALAPLGLRPSRAFLRPSLGPFDPMDRSVHRGLAPATTGEAIPRRQVRSRDLAAARPRRRLIRGATADQRVPPLGGSPPSLGLGVGCRSSRRVTLGGVKDSISGPSP